MNKRRILFFVLVVIALLFIISLVYFMVLPQLGKTVPKTVVVPDDFPSIRSAVGNATEGDTIFVRKGTYSEILRINKSLALLGEDKDSTIVSGNGATVVFILRDGVNLTGFTIRTGEKSPKFVSISSLEQVPYAIELADVRNCNITANNIEKSSYGLFLYNSSSNNITENNIESNGYGIALTDSSVNNLILGNKIASNKIGVALYGTRNNTISGNYITDSNRGGIFMRDSESNTIARNAVINNTYGMLFSVSSNNDIHHNNFIDNQNQTDDEALHNSNLPYSVNTWDDGIEGNYWSDYNSTSSDGWEIKPYIINEYNQDRYPLVEPATILVTQYSSSVWPYSKPEHNFLLF